MLVGATGSGKTTLINSMINYYFGVEYEDNFRFKLITEEDNGKRNQAHSQTSWITAYTIFTRKDSSGLHSDNSRHAWIRYHEGN